MKILVCGGRNYEDYSRVQDVLDSLHAVTAITRLVHGNAAGADSLGLRWANENDVVTLPYAAQWKKFGKRAGHFRNQRMLDENPDIKYVVAFPGGAGTADMVNRARLKGIEIHEIID